MRANPECLMGAREVSECLGVGRKTAMRLMRQEMRTIQTGRNPNNPRYKVTAQEVNLWIERHADVHWLYPPHPVRRKRGRPRKEESKTTGKGRSER